MINFRNKVKGLEKDITKANNAAGDNDKMKKELDIL